MIKYKLFIFFTILIFASFSLSATQQEEVSHNNKVEFNVAEFVKKINSLLEDTSSTEQEDSVETDNSVATTASAGLSNYLMGWEAYVKTGNMHIAYYDGKKGVAKYPKGYPTIGFGHLAIEKHVLETVHEINGVKYRAMTHENVQALLREDIAIREKCVMNAVVKTGKYFGDKGGIGGLGLSLNQGQFDALVSFCFGGCGRFFKSSILKVLRTVPMADASFKTKLKEAFLSYAYADTRRTIEYKMFVGEPISHGESNNFFDAYNPNKLVPVF
ncbi:MAG: glycoside hydrolase family protein [Alphaproteobacteria bacterium]|nr:MAG: hypothetical protein B6I23_00220 [Rickettsiaceae bacterium 4572_127]